MASDMSRKTKHWCLEIFNMHDEEVKDRVLQEKVWVFKSGNCMGVATTIADSDSFQIEFSHMLDELVKIYADDLVFQFVNGWLDGHRHIMNYLEQRVQPHKPWEQKVYENEINHGPWSASLVSWGFEGNGPKSKYITGWTGIKLSDWPVLSNTDISRIINEKN